MHICRPRAEHLLFQRGNMAEMILLGGCRHHRVKPEFLCLLIRLGGKLPGKHVIRFSGSADEIERHRRKLGGSTALQKQHPVVFGDLHQRPQFYLRVTDNRLKIRRAVRHFHHRHAALPIADQLRRRSLQYRQRQHGGSCRKIEYAFLTHCQSTSEIMN